MSPYDALKKRLLDAGVMVRVSSYLKHAPMGRELPFGEHVVFIRDSKQIGAGVVHLHDDGGYSLFIEQKGIRIPDDVQAICDLAKTGVSA